MRCDCGVGIRRHEHLEVSIHTPTWGVTLSLRDNIWSVTFQSTHLHEVWPFCVNMRHGWDKFQSTHLHEVWLLIVWTIRLIRCFNPHTYMRCDQDLEQYLNNQQFQSTHLHEVWPAWKAATGWSTCFNPHTYMRCDRFFCEMSKPERCFNPHTYMRCD